MNKLKGHIASISVQGSLSLVKIQAGPFLLSSIVIDTPQTAAYLNIGRPVHAIFKETEVIMANGAEHVNISLQNQIPGTINSIDSGELLSKVSLDTKAGKIVAVITTNAVRQLGLTAGREVLAMIKTNEMMISE